MLTLMLMLMLDVDVDVEAEIDVGRLDACIGRMPAGHCDFADAAAQALRHNVQ